MKIPNLDSFSTRLPLLRAKKAELNIDITKFKSECAIIRARMQESRPDPGNESEKRLRQILGEAPVEVTLPDAERLKQLLTELEILNAAVSTIDAAIQKETRLASNAMLESVKPEIMRLGSDFGKAFLELRLKHSDYNSFLNQIEDAGGNVSTLRITPNGLSSPEDRSGNYAYGLREFADAGFLPKTVVPELI